MTYRPGERFLHVAASAIVLAILSAWWNALAWGVLFVIFLALVFVVIDFRILRHAESQIKLERKLPVCQGRGRSWPLRWTVRNNSAHPWSGLLRDVLPPTCEPRVGLARFALSPGEEQAFVTSCRIDTRGKWNIGPFWCRLTGPCQMLEKIFTREVNHTIRILPEGAAAHGELKHNKKADVNFLDKQIHTRQRGQGSEFESIDEYTIGDDVRRIDWRQSARHGRLMMRRYQIEQHQDVMLLIDSGRLMGANVGWGTKLDRAIDAALMLAEVALEKGDRCGVGIFDDRVLGYLPPQGGAQSYRTLLDCIYDVQGELRETNFNAMFARFKAKQQKRSLVVVLSDLVDTDTTSLFRSALASLTKQHVVIFAALQTPLLEKTLRDKINSLHDMSRTVIASRLLQERENALHSLRRAGVCVLDAHPKELTVPLINQYIQLREMNRM